MADDPVTRSELDILLDRLRDEIKQAGLPDTYLQQQVEEAYERATRALALMPANTVGSIPEGHIHNALSGAPGPPGPPGSPGGAHAILDGSVQHTDAALGTPTKGDIIAGSGTLWDDLPVGADSRILTADSTQTLGLAWSPVSAITGIVAYFIRNGFAGNRPETGLVGGEVWFSTDTSQLFIRTTQ